jgi:hypothetical protein
MLKILPLVKIRPIFTVETISTYCKRLAHSADYSNIRKIMAAKKIQHYYG